MPTLTLYYNIYFCRKVGVSTGLNGESVVEGYGADGLVKKPSGREIKKLVYVMLEHVAGGLLFDLCQILGGQGRERAI